MSSGQPALQQVQLRNVVVDISAFGISNDHNDVIITYSLGSCLGLTIYDPVARVAGLVHCMLPLAKIDRQKAAAKPGMFVETGVPALLDAAFKLGATRKNLVLKATGCGRPMDDKGFFKIGERNHIVLRKLLWKNNLLLAAEHVGGKMSRTVSISVATGEVTVRVGGPRGEVVLL
ncbi:chemotaxis protein CheD [Gemmatimonadota bacterium]